MTLPLRSAPLEARSVPTPLLHPLDQFYTEQGLLIPSVRPLRGEEVPEPYRRLLVHNTDMTSTLELFHGGPAHLEVLRREERGGYYYREVALLLDTTGLPIEFGAIKIHLDAFAPPIRRLILEEKQPLGRIIYDQAIDHTSRPRAFFEVESDDLINQALRLAGAWLLYGRRNTLADGQGRPFAEIVEILPPAEY